MSLTRLMGFSEYIHSHVFTGRGVLTISSGFMVLMEGRRGGSVSCMALSQAGKSWIRKIPK